MHHNSTSSRIIDAHSDDNGNWGAALLGAIGWTLFAVVGAIWLALLLTSLGATRS